MTQQRRLASYLRARRERLRPEDVGIAPDDGSRRVVGLRREEVAILAGISTDYYLRLEQGRDLNPSDQVLDALARALQLDETATEYLRGLARPPHGTEDFAREDTVVDSIRWLIDSWTLAAAVVHSRHSDVLASNALARKLNRNFAPGHNSLLALFEDPAQRTFHTGWEGLAARSVALLRTTADTRGSDARLDAVVAKGCALSPHFRESWERGDVIGLSDGVHVLNHPRVGELSLTFRNLPLAGTAGQAIFVYVAEPGSASESKLKRLAGSD